MFVVDIETYDPNLDDLGDGAIRKDGWIYCIGIYDGTTYRCCFNETVDEYVNPVWSDPSVIESLVSNEDKVFHNGVYDMSWLCCGYNIPVGGKIHDTMTRMCLIDEEADMNLDACCKRFNIKGKNYNESIDTWFNSIKQSANIKRGTFWSNLHLLYKSSACRDNMVKYNRQDCVATYNLFNAQELYIKQVAEAYDLECDLYPVLMMLKKNGARIDVGKRDVLRDKIKSDFDKATHTLNTVYGITPEILRSSKKLTVALNNIGVYSPVKTTTGAQSWCADALDLIDHPVVRLMQESKNCDAVLNKFIGSTFTKFLVGDHIHATFTPMKREDGGTRTGRFACSKPNLQNISSNDFKHGQKSYGHEMRSLFIPEDGCVLGAFDYSQVEYLLFTHFSKGPQAEWILGKALEGVDFHNIVMELTGIPDRKAVKRVNFGVLYGMGVDTMYESAILFWNDLAKKVGMTGKEYVIKVYNTYIQKFQVIKHTMSYYQNLTKAQGYLRTIGGRIAHKPKPVFLDGKWNTQLYKMLNKLIQGSAADVLKRALVDCYKAGVFDVLKFHVTVHDENVVSIPYNKIGTEAALSMKHYMESAFSDRLSVKLKAEGGVGPDWSFKEDSKIWDNMQKGIFDYKFV